MTGPYKGRPQTKAKHYILKNYLQTLSFKVLSHWTELVYVDGFSGPWKSKTEDFSDTSFMIALTVLKDVQNHWRTQGREVSIKCFFVERDAAAYALLSEAVAPFRDEAHGFDIRVRRGHFEDAIGDIKSYMGRAFALTFIDPTGWKGYAYDRIRPVLQHDPGEVLINFMYDHINRFSTHPDPKIVASLDPILGGEGWSQRLDPALARGPALEKLFRQTLASAGRFKYTLSTRIDKETQDRPHFCIAYGTRSAAGLEAFRNIEHSALRGHEAERTSAKISKKASSSGMEDLFADLPVANSSSVEALVDAERSRARAYLLGHLEGRPKGEAFDKVWPMLLQSFIIRKTDVKQLCAALAKEGVLENTWKCDGKKVPHDNHHIIRASTGH